MFSLTKTINRLDLDERLYKQALGCYVAAISAIQEYPLDAEAEIVRRFKDELCAMQAEVADTREPEVLAESLQTLSSILKEYYRSAKATAAEKESDLRAVMAALGEAALLLGQQHSVHADKLRSFTDRLQNTEKLTDLSRMRAQIVSHVADLRSISDEVRKESDAAILAMQSQLSEFSRRLDDAEERACHDGLTGLLNRTEGERRLIRLLQTGRAACALLVDLNGFKKVNDTWGHPAGDQVLKHAARVLAEQTRPGDLVCRWGGDEFLVVIQGDQSVGTARAETFKVQLRRPQRIGAQGKMIDLVLSASIGVEQLRVGESVDDLISRVDAEMYKRKREIDQTKGSPS
jgi:diguanylate cyclase (GGDEF)-like protein